MFGELQALGFFLNSSHAFARTEFGNSIGVVLEALDLVADQISGFS